MKHFTSLFSGMAVILIFSFSGFCQQGETQSELDKKVKSFLDNKKENWHNLNVPAADGMRLHDLILKNSYKNVLEVGTSTGRSAIYMAWALSKTGGKLITIEIDEQRYNEAVENFKKAGLSDYIDARLSDAHEAIYELKAPFDFIFLDADKGWYTKYAKAVLPLLKTGGCIAAHNVTGTRGYGTGEYYSFILGLPYMETELILENSAGMAVSYKREEQK